MNGLQLNPLVSLKSKHKVNNSDLQLNTVEAAFRIPGYRGLWLDARSWNKEAACFYAARSVRSPENLLNHVQRIMHHIQQNNAEGVYGALLDLFIVLDNHGLALRERMLNYARELLNEMQYSSLKKMLDKDVSALDTLPTEISSVLSRGFSGTFRLVEKINSSDESDRDILVEARSYMEYGQLDSARSTLEKAVLDGSLEPDIHTDLIDIYRHSQDQAKFLRLYSQLQITQKSLILLWEELNDFFKANRL